jgi:hypothetical protein
MNQQDPKLIFENPSLKEPILIDEVQLQQKGKKAPKHVLEKIHIDAIHKKTYLYTESQCLEAIQLCNQYINLLS